MAIKNFKLIQKNKLTNDVFELTFKSNEILNSLAGQFITFLLPNGIWWKAYSILEDNGDNFKLIIKRIENWWWGSKFICDSEVWDTLKWVWPTWKFILQETNNNKLFFWTWTWFVPLYYQIIESLKKLDCKLKLVFWVRSKEDLFYIEELKKLEKENENFSFRIFLSWEKIQNYSYWRITSFINTSNIENFSEFYICWNPIMVDDVEEKLLNLWNKKESILHEKY